MKKILFTTLFVCSLLAHTAFAQEEQASSAGRICITSFVPHQTDALYSAVENALESKLCQAVAGSGMVSTKDSRFALIPRIVVADKQTQASVPPMVVISADITFYIGDVSNGKVFSSYTQTYKGVGQNETKAYKALVASIKPKGKELHAFMEEGRKKILDYYSQQTPIIIKQAQALAAAGQYAEAMLVLLEIPEECPEYSEVSDILISVFQQGVDQEGEVLFNKANAIWNASLSYDGANEAASILQQIHPSSSAIHKANALLKSIAKRISEIDKREWSYQVQEQKNQAELNKAYIAASRDVVVAQAHRPVYNYNVVWW